jgi:hypothetical protein
MGRKEIEMGIDAIIALVGLLAPPTIDLVKKFFIKPGTDSPEATMNTLATTKPDSLGPYIDAMAKLLTAQAAAFNKDVVGIPSQWVVNLRSSIRPAGTVVSILILAVLGYLALTGTKIDPTMKDTIDGVRYTCEGIASSWFGSRISLSK